MQNAHNRHRTLGKHVVNRIVSIEQDTKPRAQLLAGRIGLGEHQQPVKACLDPGKQAGCDSLRCFGGDIRPDFGKVSLGGVG